MATFTVDTSAINISDRAIQCIPRDLKKAVDAGGAVARIYIAQEARETFNRNYDADHARGTTAAGTTLKRAAKRADGYAAYVTFNGTRADGWCGTVRRVAEVAFVNEYGAPGKRPGGHPARPFIQKAIDKHESEIVEAIENALPDL